MIAKAFVLSYVLSFGNQTLSYVDPNLYTEAQCNHEAYLIEQEVKKRNYHIIELKCTNIFKLTRSIN